MVQGYWNLKRKRRRNERSERADSYVISVNWPLSGSGGVNEVILNLAHQVEKLSTYHTVIAVTTWDYAEQPRQVRGTEVVNLRFRGPIGPGGISQIPAAFRTLPVDAWRLLRFIRERRVQVWNAHFPASNVFPLLVLKWVGLFKGEFVLSFHGADFCGTGWTALVPAGGMACSHFRGGCGGRLFT